MRKLEIADLFCGAGGTSTGAARAGSRCGYSVRITAVNHNRVAIRTHAANHTEARHLCTGLDAVDPRHLYKPGELDILLASPECTNHSNARGGKPINDQSRATALCVTRWAEALLPWLVVIENVVEFQKWGPLDSKNRPIKRRQGELFHAWLNMFRASGYRVEYREICFADFGDPTTRTRLIIQCVRGRRKIVWPDPTHGPLDPLNDLFGQRRSYVPARECIDWSIVGKSIFDRKKPLVEKTIRRILHGFEQYALSPYLIPSKSGRKRIRSVNRPLHTITTESRGEGLAQAFIVEHRGTHDAAIAHSSRSVEKPISAITTSGAHHALASSSLIDPDFSFLVQTAHGEGAGEKGNGHGRRVRSTEDPLPAVCGNRGDWSLTSILIGQQSGAVARSTNDPAPTLATTGAIGKVDFVITSDHQSATDASAVRHVDQSLSSVTSKARHCLITTFLVSYYSTNCVSSSSAPVPALTCKARFGAIGTRLLDAPHGTFRRVKYEAWKRLVLAQARKGKPMSRLYVETVEEGVKMVEMTHRMLFAKELALAQGFPRDYEFHGNNTQKVKQIGNAVPPNGACAILTAALTQNSDVAWLWDCPDSAAQLAKN